MKATTAANNLAFALDMVSLMRFGVIGTVLLYRVMESGGRLFDRLTTDCSRQSLTSVNQITQDEIKSDLGQQALLVRRDPTP